MSNIDYQNLKLEQIPWKQTTWLGPGDPPGEYHHVLHVEPQTGAMSLLVRFEPNYAGQSLEWHSVAQELFLLEGDLNHTGTELRAPAFVYVPARAVHGKISSKNGALLYVRIDGPLDTNYVAE